MPEAKFQIKRKCEVWWEHLYRKDIRFPLLL